MEEDDRVNRDSDRSEPRTGFPSQTSRKESKGVLTVKKIIVLVLVALGAFAIYRKIQADRAELDLWTEATAASES